MGLLGIIFEVLLNFPGFPTRITVEERYEMKRKVQKLKQEERERKTRSIADESK